MQPRGVWQKFEFFSLNHTINLSTISFVILQQPYTHINPLLIINTFGCMTMYSTLKFTFVGEVVNWIAYKWLMNHYYSCKGSIIKLWMEDNAFTPKNYFCGWSCELNCIYMVDEAVLHLQRVNHKTFGWNTMSSPLKSTFVGEVANWIAYKWLMKHYYSCKGSIIKSLDGRQCLHP